MTTDRRLVIDTNLWISRLLLPGCAAARAVDAFLQGATELPAPIPASAVALRP